MKHTETCPDADRIEQLLRSLASEAETQELAEHLDACPTCQRVAQALRDPAALEDDLHWAVEARAQAPVQVHAPLHRISEMLPDFEILKELGRGGMGVVYKARQRKLDRLVAVKILPALLGTVRPDAKARFRREAELAAALDHTNITGVHDFGEVDGTLYYVMQLIEGRSLRDVLTEIADAGTTDIMLADAPSGDASQRKSRSHSGAGLTAVKEARPTYYRKVAHWFAEVADALQYAHDRGVVHRDIKPSNLLLAEDGRLVISDFGLARMSNAESITRTRGLIGTCRYMSPEQVDSTLGPVDGQSDVYALGATLYELLTLRPLYAGTDDRELLRQVVHVDPPPPHRLMEEIPRDLETICLKAIAKERSKRYASAGAMADDLRRWLLDLPIHAKRQTFTQRAIRFVRRRKLYSALIAASGALLLATIGLWTAYNSTHDQALKARSDAIGSRVALALQDAHAALAREQLPAALQRLDQGLALEPADAELNRLKAVVLFRQGASAEAMSVLRQLLAHHPHDWKAHFLAAFALRPCHPDDWTCRCIDRTPLLGPHPADSLSGRFAAHLRAVQDWRSGEAEEFCLLACQEPDSKLAIALLNSALERDPALSEALLLRAIRSGMIMQHEAMRVDALAAVELRPGCDLAYGVLGTAYYSLDRYQDAEAAYIAAISRNPHNVLWWYDRAVVRCYQRRFEDAIADADRALAINPRYAFAYLARAKAHAGLGHRQQALDDYHHAEKLDPRIADIFIDRCQLHLLDGNYSEALADADRAVALRPLDPAGYQRRAHAYLRMGRFDDAVAQTDKCLEFDPHDAVSHLLKGIVLRDAGQYLRALLNLDRAAELNPKDVRIFRYRASNLYYLGRYQEAIGDLTRLADLGDQVPLTLMRRGMVYELLGESRLALRDYRRAAELHPQVRPYANLWECLLLQRSGDAALAENILAQHRPPLGPPEWTDRLFDFLAARIDADALFAAATSDNQRVEAYYFAGVRAAAAGRSDQAAAWLRRSSALNCDEILEGDFAYARLREMDADAVIPVCRPDQVAP